MKGKPTEEPGLGYWVARQQWRWRRGELPIEQARMLHLAGVDMDTYAPNEWQNMAHSAAETLQGSVISLSVTEGAVVPPKQQPEAAAAGKVERPLAASGSRGKSTTSADASQPRDSDRLNSSSEMSITNSSTGSINGRSSILEENDGGSLPPAPRGSRRLQACRWVQTQRALFRDGRLSPGQLRYLQFLGITWILSDEVMCMEDDAWEEYYTQLERKKNSTRLTEWLNHQRGLYALGLLTPARRAALEALNVSWQFDRPADAALWDMKLSQLLVQSVAVGNVEVLPENERFVGLREWLKEQKTLAEVGQLPSGRGAQLKALGVSLPMAALV